MNRKTGKNFLLFAAAFAVFSSHATQAQIEFSEELGTPEFQFSTIGSDQFAFCTVPATALPGLDLNFSEVGETVISFQLRSPEGKLLEITVPEGWNSRSVTFDYTIERGDAAASELAPAITVEIVGGAGELPVFPSQTAELPKDTNRIYVKPGASLSSGQTFRFKSILMSVIVPESYSNFLSGAATRFQLSFSLYSAGEMLSDPGEWVRFVDVPGPPVTQKNLALEKKLTSKLKKLTKSLRRFKRSGAIAKIARLKKKIRRVRAKLRSI